MIMSENILPAAGDAPVGRRPQQGAVHPAVLGFMAAVMLATLAGTLVQTQFNMVAIQTLGAGIGPGTWLWVTVQDLAGFSPILFIITLLCFIVAIPASAVAARLTGLPRHWVYMAGTAVGLLVALRVIDHQVPMPTLIAASRGPVGTAAMMACAAAGGWLFSAMTANRNRSAS